MIARDERLPLCCGLSRRYYDNAAAHPAAHRRSSAIFYMSVIMVVLSLPLAVQARGGELERYFDNLKYGPGLWKWTHYFDAYEALFSRWRGTDVHVLEVRPRAHESSHTCCTCNDSCSARLAALGGHLLGRIAQDVAELLRPASGDRRLRHLSKDERLREEPALRQPGSHPGGKPERAGVLDAREGGATARRHPDR